MDVEKLPKGFGGQRLAKKMKEPYVEREAYINELLYEETVLMLCAGKGTGKSCLSLQMAVALANGTPCFNYYEVPKSRKVFYIVSERTYREPEERLRAIETTTSINYDNLYLTTGLQPLDFSRENTHPIIMEYMALEIQSLGWDHLDVVIMDPLYQTMKRGVSNEEYACIFVTISNMIQQAFKCATIIVHHTNRGARNDKGKRDNEDMHGSAFLANHVSGSYAIKKFEAGTMWTKDKDNHGILTDKVCLDYDHETYLSNVNISKCGVTKKDLVLGILKTYEQNKQTITLNDIKKHSSMSPTKIWHTIRSHGIYRLREVDKTSDNRKLYLVEVA